MSPFEHQATPDTRSARLKHDRMYEFEREHVWDKPHLHGNFLGWVQHRKEVEDGAK